MSGLVGPNGAPIGHYMEYAASPGRPKNPKPVVGDAFTNWGVNEDFLHLPGGGVIAFDTSKLTMKDFRKMSEHYQIGSSLNVLTFMLHQLDFHVETDGPKSQADWCEENLRAIWTRLCRTLSSAFTFGYSANAFEWENDSKAGKLRLNKIVDFVPEQAEVNWKFVDGALPKDAPAGSLPPKIPIFDGIKRRGSVFKVNVENSFWYPLLMKNGDYGGTKLLKTAFQPWFFSSLIHLYQNKYFERFGEPVPIGRAPYNQKKKIGDKEMYGHELMSQVISMIRSRSAVVLPNDRSREGLTDTPEYDYQVEYLESQMRGADFERYLTRLDEEMSLALFTPLLLLRTADSGGFNQGVAHTQVFLWMLNAIAGDWKEYIDKYVLRPMALFNFGPNAKLPTIRFRKLGTAEQETLRAIVTAMISKGAVKPNVEELGEHIGLQLEEIEVLTEDDSDPSDPGSDPSGDNPEDNQGGDKPDPRVGRPERLKSPKGKIKPASTTKAITQRMKNQVARIFNKGISLETYEPALGFNRQLVVELEANGVDDATGAAAAFAARATGAIRDAATLGNDAWTQESFCDYAEGIINIEMERLYDGR